VNDLYSNPELTKLKRTLVLQLAGIVVPIIGLLLVQTWQMGVTADQIDKAHSINSKITSAQNNYKIFLDGVVDAIDLEKLSHDAFSSLKQSEDDIAELLKLIDSSELNQLHTQQTYQLNSLNNDLSLKALMPLRNSINISRKILDDVAKKLERSSDEEILLLERRVHLAQKISFGLVFIGIFISVFFVRYLIRRLTLPLEHAIFACTQMAGGNLDGSVLAKANSVQDIGGLIHNLNTLRTQFNMVMRQIEEAGKQMGQSAFQIAAISNEIAANSKSQESRSAQVNEATDLLSASSASVEDCAIHASERDEELLVMAGNSIKSVNRNIEEMNKAVSEVGLTADVISAVSEAAEEIRHIITTIQDIAGQTSLLALNAAIEAARAGEQGRGFAVVSDEVRSLATRTSHSAHEVTNIINKLNMEVGRANEYMKRVVVSVNSNQQQASATAQDIEQLLKGISEGVKTNRSMGSASREQIQNMSQLRLTLDQLFVTLSESTTKVDTTAHIGENMYELTEKLNALISEFKLDLLPEKHVPAGIEKRRSKRAAGNMRVNVTQGDQSIIVLSRDLSLKGISLWLTKELDQKAPVQLSIYLPSSNMSTYVDQEPIHLTGAIMWQRHDQEKILCGINFDSYTDETAEKIRHCLEFYGMSF